MLYKCLLDYAAMGTLFNIRGLYCSDPFFAQPLMVLIAIFHAVSIALVQFIPHSLLTFNYFRVSLRNFPGLEHSYPSSFIQPVIGTTCFCIFNSVHIVNSVKVAPSY